MGIDIHSNHVVYACHLYCACSGSKSTVPRYLWITKESREFGSVQ